MKDNPSIFGTSFGSYLPNVGRRFCDAESRKQLQDYFAPLVDKYDGAPRNWRKCSKAWICASPGWRRSGLA